MSKVDEAEFRSALGHFASGVVVVTGMDDGQPVGLTCQSFFSVSLDPPLIAFAPSKQSTSWPRVSTSCDICVNILAAEQEDTAQVFAKSGADKFAEVEWIPAYHGAPRLLNALVGLDCRIRDVHEAGDHWLVVAEVLETQVGSGRPLLFYRGNFSGIRS